MWQHITVIPELGGKDKSQEVALNLLPAHTAKPENSRFNEKLSSKMSRASKEAGCQPLAYRHTYPHTNDNQLSETLKTRSRDSFQGNLVLPYAKEILSSLTLLSTHNSH